MLLHIRVRRLRQRPPGITPIAKVCIKRALRAHNATSNGSPVPPRNDVLQRLGLLQLASSEEVDDLDAGLGADVAQATDCAGTTRNERLQGEVRGATETQEAVAVLARLDGLGGG